MNDYRKPNRSRSRLSAASLAACAVALALAACTETPTPTPTVAPTMPPPVVVDEPTPVPPPEPAAAVPVVSVVSAEGVSFAADPALAVSPQPVLVPAVAKSDAPAFGGAAPDHLLFSFGDKIQPELIAPNDAQLRIFPAAAYAAVDPSIAQTIAELTALLANRPAEITGTLPVLPPLPAAQVLHAQAQFLDFRNGAGLRFLTAYAQDVSPITRDRLFYTFQGLTADGKYYIVLFHPVSSAALPATFEETPAATDMDAFVRDFDLYLAETVALLDAQPAAEFAPDLALLDGLMQSLDVAPTAPAMAVADSPAEPAAAAGEAASITARTTAAVNVRSGPTTRNRIVARLRRAVEVPAVGRNEAATWIQVRWRGEQTGWISATYLRSDADWMTLPVVPAP